MSADPQTYLTPQALLAWLNGHGDTETVGLPVVSTACPLASYLTEKTGHLWRVLGQTAEPLRSERQGLPLDLPLWANRFTFLVDIHAGGSISAAEARECLHQALHDTLEDDGEDA